MPTLTPLLLVMAVVEMVVIFGFILPGVDTYRQVKPFALSLSTKVGHNEKIVFYKTTNTTLAYYLDLKEAIPIINRRSELPALGNKWIIILEEADKNEFLKEFPDIGNATPVLKEDKVSEKLPSSTTGLMAYRLF